MDNKKWLAGLAACVVSYTAGWFQGRGDPSGPPVSAPPGLSAPRPVAASVRAQKTTPNIPVQAEASADDAAFLSPVTEADRTRIRTEVRRALEDQINFSSRMASVSAVLARLTPENAAEFTRVFDESWRDGRDFGKERTLFLFRLGEVTGAEGIKLLSANPAIRPDDLEFVVEGWAAVDSAAAIQWTNNLPPDQSNEGFVDSVFWGAGMHKPEYAMEIFKLQDERQQASSFQALLRVNRLRGGHAGVTALAGQMLESSDSGIKKWGETALRETSKIYRKKSPEEYDQWWNALPESSRNLLQKASAP